MLSQNTITYTSLRTAMTVILNKALPNIFEFTVLFSVEHTTLKVSENVLT